RPNKKKQHPTGHRNASRRQSSLESVPPCLREKRRSEATPPSKLRYASRPPSEAAAPPKLRHASRPSPPAPLLPSPEGHRTRPNQTRTMSDLSQLRSVLHDLDRASYRRYRSIAGSWRAPDFVFVIDHVQGDPFSDPSRVRALVPPETVALPEWALR